MECHKGFKRCSILNGILSDFPAISYVKDLIHHPIDSQPCIQMVTVWPSIKFLSYNWFVSPLTNHLPSAAISFRSFFFWKNVQSPAFQRTVTETLGEVLELSLSLAGTQT